MATAKIIPFPIDKANKIDTGSQVSVYDLFPKQVADDFMEYHRQSSDWRNHARKNTIYDGYPWIAPCDPVVEGLVWYTDEMKGFGVWVLNKSGEEIQLNKQFDFGWSPFVRKSTAPPHEPVHIQSVEIRNYLIWYVDKDGYGQYGMLQKDGTVWLPQEKPVNWES